MEKFLAQQSTGPETKIVGKHCASSSYVAVIHY